MTSKSKSVIVIGAGISGLSVAYVLIRSGYSVRVLADRRGTRTSSGVSGAVWYPFLVSQDGDRRTHEWARQTYDAFAGLQSLAPGIHGPLPMYLIVDDRAVPGWSQALPEEVSLLWTESHEVPLQLREHMKLTRATGAWKFQTFVVDPEVFLDWLDKQVQEFIEVVSVLPSLDSLLRQYPDDVFVNCTGRRSRALADDHLLKPAYGQIVVAQDPHLPRNFTFADDRNEQEMFYLIPRGEKVVLGGCNLPSEAGESASWTQPESPSPSPKLQERILGRFHRAGFSTIEQAEGFAEWRPVRGNGAVRLERDGQVIHNYGHGGSGFTLCFGCAQNVMDELSKDDDL